MTRHDTFFGSIGCWAERLQTYATRILMSISSKEVIFNNFYRDAPLIHGKTHRYDFFDDILCAILKSLKKDSIESLSDIPF